MQLDRLDAGPGGDGAIWSTVTDDLNLNVVDLSAGASVAEHVNSEVDVVVLVIAGSLVIRVDGTAHDLQAHGLAVAPKHARRGLTAGPQGARYLTVHRRRAPLGIGGTGGRDAPKRGARG